MKAIFITKEIKLNGIVYYPGTTLTKECCEFIAKNKKFPGINDVNCWWATIINPISDKITEKVQKVILNIIGEEEILYFKIYTII